MQNITSRAAFIHVDVPGQEDGAPDLPAEYVYSFGSLAISQWISVIMYKTSETLWFNGT